jgi:hypothetical protein
MRAVSLSLTLTRSLVRSGWIRWSALVSELGGNVGLRIEWFAPGQTYPVNVGLDREAHRVRDRSDDHKVGGWGISAIFAFIIVA